MARHRAQRGYLRRPVTLRRRRAGSVARHRAQHGYLRRSVTLLRVAPRPLVARPGEGVVRAEENAVARRGRLRAPLPAALLEAGDSPPNDECGSNCRQAQREVLPQQAGTVANQWGLLATAALRRPGTSPLCWREGVVSGGRLDSPIPPPWPLWQVIPGADGRGPSHSATTAPWGRRREWMAPTATETRRWMTLLWLPCPVSSLRLWRAASR